MRICSGPEPTTTKTLAVFRESDGKCIMTIFKETEHFNYDGDSHDFEHGTGSTRTGFRISLNSITISNTVNDVDCLNEPEC